MFDINKIKTNKIFKTIIFIFALFICIVSITNVIIAFDLDHISHCNDDDCSHCAMIHFCQIQAKLMFLSIPPMIIALIMLNKQKIFNLLNNQNNKQTLIEYKIQLNI